MCNLQPNSPGFKDAASVLHSGCLAARSSWERLPCYQIHCSISPDSLAAKTAFLSFLSARISIVLILPGLHPHQAEISAAE